MPAESTATKVTKGISVRFPLAKLNPDPKDVTFRDTLGV